MLELDTLGLLNGCIDPLYEAPHYAQLAYNSTYGLQMISEVILEFALNNYTMHGGCRDLLLECRAFASKKDPQFNGNDPEVNAACVGAFEVCFEYDILGTNFGPSNIVWSFLQI